MKRKSIVLSAIVAVLAVVVGLLVWNHFYGRGDVPVWDRVDMGRDNATRVEPPRSERVPEDMLTFSLNRTAREADKAGEAADAAPTPTGPAAKAEQAGNETVPAEPREDNVVTWAFGDSLAAVVANAYYPKGSHPQAVKRGMLMLGAKRLNMRYGSRMTGLRVRADNVLAARRLVFEYALPRTAMRFLYGLYADRFVEALDARAHALTRDTGTGDKPLSDAQVAELFSLAADKAGALAAVLRVCADMDDLPARVAAYHDAVEGTLDANETFVNKLQMYEEARDTPESTADYRQQMQRDMEAAGQAYQQAIRSREKVRSKLAADVLPRAAAKVMTQDEALYVARWCGRRLAENPEYRESLAEASAVLDDLSGRLRDHVR